MLTLRKQWFKPTAAEMLWYLSGSTNVEGLHAHDVHVWDQWATPETAGTLGWRDGELGPIYGAQWRDFGGRVYKPGIIEHVKGFDQISYILKLLRENPHSKRGRVVGWNTPDMERCFVATCHGDLFFSVLGEQLHMEMVQRSGDAPIGVPFNTAAYALLLLMFAQCLSLQPGVFSHHIWDAHVYEDQEDGVRAMLQREPKTYPTLKINPDVTDMFAFTLDDFELVGYDPHPVIRIPVAT
ncbi:MAG TPA: thymidylate synthase [Candidatus Nanoarchaeia archaeon]|nr:thymidylate synthase [Candidatus Nanoarchaeia archaeon]